MFSASYATREVALMNNREFFRARLDDPGMGANYIFVDYPSYTPAANNLPTQAAVNQVMPAGSSRNSAFYVNPATGTIFRLGNALTTGYDGQPPRRISSASTTATSNRT